MNFVNVPRSPVNVPRFLKGYFRPDPLVRENFKQKGVRDTPVNDMGFLNAAFERVDADRAEESLALIQSFFREARERKKAGEGRTRGQDLDGAP